jgi:oligoendopeptidase F
MPDPSLTLPARHQIPVQDTWDTNSVFPNDAAWEAACKDIQQRLPRLAGFQDRLGESPEVLLDWLSFSGETANLMEKIFFYAYSFHAVDTTDQAANARVGQARSLSTELQTTAAFAVPELMELGFEKLQSWMAAEPRLAIYRHHFQRLEDRRAHVRSAEVEAILALVSDPFGTASSTADLLTDADLTFAPAVSADQIEHEVAQGSIEKLKNSADRALRRTSWESYADGHLAFKNTLANCLTAAIKQNVFRMRTRQYPSSLAASLAPNRIPTDVFHNLIEVFKRNLPTWHRYWRVRRQALGYEELHPYDVFAPLTPNPPHIPFEQAVEWITEGMAPLGESYTKTLRRGVLDERWVDRYPNKGKSAGAFSYGAYGTHPFILMSHTGNLRDLSTLAHELGHSMHSYLSWKSQPWIYGDYSLFVAEVASNFNQALVRAYLFEQQKDADFQIAIIEELMSNFYRYFFIMPTLARFELETHERVERGEPLTAESMVDLMADLFAEAYGPDVVIDRPRVGITWAQFGHLYAHFYVYQYATGIAAAQALADGVLNGNPEAAERYLNFLKAGGSLYPLEALKLAGVDLTSPETVEAGFAVLSDTVARLEVLTA